MLKKSASARRLLFGLFSLSGFLVERNKPDRPDEPDRPGLRQNSFPRPANVLALGVPDRLRLTR
jgi:hypothetical protein